LLSDDDVGIGELEDDMEIPLQMLSPLKRNLISNPIEPISVRSKVKIHKKGKKNVRSYLAWEGHGLL
jgi:hypothetical protein